MIMLHIGCHLSSSRGYAHMGKEALSIGADTFQFFTRNPRGGTAKALNTEDLEALRRLLEEHGFTRIIAHAPYTLNEILNQVLQPGQHTTVLLETMAGKGSEVGRRFEELRAILDRVEQSDHLGVCLDTCHVWDAGYDIAGDLDGVLAEFDRVLGLERLKAIHLNDSMNPLGAHKDRHAKIGEGCIGTAALSAVTNHPLLQGLPFCLETPNDLSGYAAEIALLRDLHRD